MNIYKKTCASPLRNCRLAVDGQRRWVSYEKSDLTKDVLLRQVESKLGRNASGQPIKVDPDRKTIETDSGSLPISPLMDPAWMKARRRQRKEPAGKISGQFRKKLSNNPYAQALITPLRWCKNTNKYLPRYFLQDIELVKHPDPAQQKEPWFAPGPLSFENVKPWSIPRTNETTHEGRADAAPQPLSIEEVKSTLEENDSALGEVTEERRNRRAPWTSYILARKSTLDAVWNSRTKLYVARLSSKRSGMLDRSTRGTAFRVWRPDLGDVVLEMLRREAVDVLIMRSDKSKQEKFVKPVASWEEAKEVVGGGSILWFPKSPMGNKNSYATLDNEGANFGSKMAVHDMAYLLGEEEVERLRKESETLRDQEISVLRNWKSESMRSLHLLLWRLQGYLAEPKIEKIEENEENEETEENVENEETEGNEESQPIVKW
ncbi:hypothetical protein NW762_006638 [Fusarium torreyae]|uniref:Uncharacterized protein n=1 Tax=Fusarium torreyae TaxID=1237075 RepID=A0A9W8S2B1_9HYPO|nr:hypothetical protein NW762_006638 [Fusarium torreyae]